MHELTQVIKAEAHRLGFVLAGVTQPKPPPHLGQYQAWLQAGYHASMNYLSSERAYSCRIDPTLILPGCRSIIVLALPYNSPLSIEPPARHAPYGRTAAYAWGIDYHTVIKDRLQKLGNFITALLGAGVQFKGYTDTGPILERDLAQRAGLGWIGKNTCLINPHIGSYFFLAELFLSIDLAIDKPFTADYCGTCQRCAQVCPTGCILPGRILDASRCISYLTIENKCAIPEILRPSIGNWVFGCDLCQIVCPWNVRFAPMQGDPAFLPKPSAAFPELASELLLTPTEFGQKYRGSPILRARRRGYFRNLAITLGNTRDQQSLSLLKRLALSEEDALVREAIVWSLAQYTSSP
jgi:epoxyqueuosine reductase